MEAWLWILLAVMAVLAMTGLFIWELSRMRKVRERRRVEGDVRGERDDELEQAVRRRAVERPMLEDDYVWEDVERRDETGRPV